MLSKLMNRRRGRLTALLATAAASLALVAGTHALPSDDGAQTARSSWSVMAPETASVGRFHTLRSSWS
jgi:hypothetical protein